MRGRRRLGVRLARGLVFAVMGAVVLLLSAIALAQTSWSENKLRGFIVDQANRYLSATLEIGQLRGSLLSGIELGDVRLSRDGETLVAIDRVEVSYSLRELVDGGTLIRRLSLVHPQIVAAKQADGRWNLASLIRRDPQRARNRGPGRAIRIDAIEITDGTVTLRDPLSFGAAHVPASFTKLNTSLSFSYEPFTWTLDFTHASFNGDAPTLLVRELTGVVGSGEAGWLFRGLRVVTPRSDFTLDGRIDRSQSPTTLDLNIEAPRFAFQEWSGVLRGLTNIAVVSGFDARLLGPTAAMKTTVALRSSGGDVQADLVLNATVPGWHATGTADVRRLNLARWLNRPERPSDISGNVILDLNLQLGGRFPRGSFTFKGPHAAYLEYEADDVDARGTISPTEVLIARATATAYGANVRLADSTIAIDSPFAFRFIGTARGVDLRQVPRSVPVPRVESTLAFDYDVTGRFTKPFIRGSATFADSTFLDATLGAGATGFIDTDASPFQYGGEGDLSNVDLNHFGDRLAISWLTDPRYDGTVRGHFHVDGTGSDLSTMTLKGGGRLMEADLFGGRLADADVTIAIANGSLEAGYDGELSHVDPSIAMDDRRYAAQLTGHARGHVGVRDLLIQSPELNDYTLDVEFAAVDTVIRGFEVLRGDVHAAIDTGTLRIERLVSSGPAIDLEARGSLELDGVRSSQIEYNVTRSDLSKVASMLGRDDLSGEGVTSGRLTGPLNRMRFEGNGTVSRVAASGVEVLTTVATYDATIPSDDPRSLEAKVNGRLSTVKAFGQILQVVDGVVTYDAGRVSVALDSVVRDGLDASLSGSFVLDVDARQVDVETLALTALRTSWRLAPGARPRIGWTQTGVNIGGLDLVDAGSGRQHLTVSGTWDQSGAGPLRIAAAGVAIEALTADGSAPPRYGGLLDGTAVVRGTVDRPLVSADFTVTAGRIRRLSYDKFAGHLDYADEIFQLDVRLDQGPGIWITGTGSVPLSLFDTSLSPQAMRFAVKSSPVSLALLEGVTDVVRNVGGQMELDVSVVGTSRDPHFDGRVDLTGASFDVVSSGARYRNGRVALRLTSDRVGVDTLHIEDEEGHPLDVTGSLGTHELRVGDLEVEVRARGFQVLRNQYGRVNVDALMNLAGEFESPKLTGRLTITGGSLNVDNLLDRTLFRPYSTQAETVPSNIDAIAALNPWDRIGMDIELRVPGTLRMLGENVQVTPGTPLGLGNINLRAFGDLYLYKDPAKPLYVNGSIDSLTGTYAFQGRRFELDPSSSINFRGDLNPELYVTVSRVISGVEARVSILGSLQEPELRLASTPPLDQSDILSLIVFNTSINELSASQQQQLAVRAGTIAAGFLTAPLVSSLQKTLGLDTLEIEPGSDVGSNARVTVGNELAPGLVARFSRQFGDTEYNEATVEYYLSRILRIRATFSDAGTLTAVSPFRRVERAGVDLLLFFSF